MAYSKLIQSGEFVEEWEYEREPDVISRGVTRKPRVKKIYRQERRFDSILAARRSFQRLVRANIREGEPLGLLTLTTEQNTTVSDGYKQYTRFASELRRRFHMVKIIAVPEFQRRGAVHFHALVWGLPDELLCSLSRTFYLDRLGKKKRTHACPESKPCERRTRILARIWRVGFLDLVATDSSPRLVAYLAKYMSKALHDKRLMGKRAYTATRNVVRPMSLNTAYQIYCAKVEWGFLEPGGIPPLVQYKEYVTMFLGRCVYKSYVLNHGTQKHCDDAAEG